MQRSVNKPVLLRGKRFFLILGLVLLVAGFSLIIVYLSSIIKPYIVWAESVNATVTNGSYSSSDSRAVEGDWIEFNIAATNRSFLQLRALDLPLTENSMVYSSDHSFDETAALYGINYTDTIPINVTSRYTVELDNWAAHLASGPRGPDTVTVYDTNTFLGSFYLLGMPNYYPYLLAAGGALIAASCGLFLIPTLAYLRLKARHFGIPL